MKYITIEGSRLIKNPPQVNGYWLLHEGDGELLGVGIQPSHATAIATELAEYEKKKKDKVPLVKLYCRDLVNVLDLDKRTIVSICKELLAGCKEEGLLFREAHYSNMSPINFKFKQRLLVKGPIRHLWFYLKV